MLIEWQTRTLAQFVASGPGKKNQALANKVKTPSSEATEAKKAASVGPPVGSYERFMGSFGRGGKRPR